MMLKSLFDILLSILLITILLPVFLILSLLIFLDDFRSPFYVAKRVGLNGIEFNMYKFRSMRPIEHLNHVVSTSDNDPRITKIGKFIRKYKFDELSQVFNVIIGNMSIVGPRPNVKVEVDLYSKVELNILTLKPGITDLSSIVFFDLNHILKNSRDPNTDYNQLVRPWKSQLALFYVKNHSIRLDLEIIFLTFVSLFSRKVALKGVRNILTKFSANSSLIEVCTINKKLKPQAPPGLNEVVTAEYRSSIAKKS